MSHKMWTIAMSISVGRSDSEGAILVPKTASAVSAIMLPLRAVFHPRPFTETFETQKEKDGKREIKEERKREREQREGKCFCSPERSSLMLAVNKRAADDERRC